MDPKPTVMTRFFQMLPDASKADKEDMAAILKTLLKSERPDPNGQPHRTTDEQN